MLVCSGKVELRVRAKPRGLLMMKLKFNFKNHYQDSTCPRDANYLTMFRMMCGASNSPGRRDMVPVISNDEVENLNKLMLQDDAPVDA